MKTAHISFMPHLIKGVEKKTIQMAKAACEVGFDCDFYILNNEIDSKNENLIYKKFTLLKIPLSLKKQQQLFTHLLIAKNIDFDSYDFVILRYAGAFSLGGYYFFKKYGYKLLTEHQTNEDIEYRLYRKGFINWVKFGLEPLCSRVNLKNVRAIIGVTQEIVELELKKSGTKPSLALPNGIDVEGVPFTPAKLFNGDSLKMLFIASGEASWHGLDRVIRAISDYRGALDIELHVVGKFDRDKYRDFAINIVEHGTVEGAQLDAICGEIHIGISSMALGSLGLKSASVLKSREYMARGVPFIYGYDDEDFKEVRGALRVDSLTIEEIVAFLKTIDATQLNAMREFAKEQLDWQKKIRSLSLFLAELQQKKRFKSAALSFAYSQFQDAGIRDGAKVLEFGCGEGKELVAITKSGDIAYGVDVLDFKCDAAKANLADHGIDAGQVRLIEQDRLECFTIPFEDGFFDAIFSHQVFEHVKNMDLAAQELYRVLRPGGVVFSEFAATYPLRDSHTGLPPLHLLKNRKAIYLGFLFFRKVGVLDSKRFRKNYLYYRRYLSYRSYSEMDRSFRDAGFEVEDLTYKRREERLRSDGVGTFWELLQYKFFKKHGNAQSLGFCVQIYLIFHAFFYRLTKNRVILLRKRSG